jgi:DNA-binding PadR family transcriptional regulator
MRHGRFHGPDRQGWHDQRFARGERCDEGPGFGRMRHRGQGGGQGGGQWGGPGGGRTGGRSGLGRFFAHGDLRLVILHLIAEKPRHGYEIIKAIEDQVAGAYSPSPGVIYPALTLLEELGYVTVSTAPEGGRKLHTITEQGRAFLAANRPALDALLARMEQAGRDRGDEPAPQIVRAMENLRLALRLRLSREPLSAEQVDAVAALLDTAATSVEKI